MIGAEPSRQGRRNPDSRTPRTQEFSVKFSHAVRWERKLPAEGSCTSGSGGETGAGHWGCTWEPR